MCIEYDWLVMALAGLMAEEMAEAERMLLEQEEVDSEDDP